MFVKTLFRRFISHLIRHCGRSDSKSKENLCLTVIKGEFSVGQEVHLADCLDDANENAKYQRWSGPSPGVGGLESVIIGDSNPFCLDRGEGNSPNGTVLKLAVCSEGDGTNGTPIPSSQLWSFDESDNHIFAYASSDESDNTKNCIDIKQDSGYVTGGGDPFLTYQEVQLWECIGENTNQMWDIVPADASG
ncbi:hypothetical protein V866_001387 [Kwoniella sp. B9012]